MCYCCDTVGKPETGLHAVQVMLLCTIAVTQQGSLRLCFTLSGNVAMYYCCDIVGKSETGLHAVQVMLLYTIAVTLWESLRLGFILCRQCCYVLLL